jgi:16S rRNA processing protein RimM
LNGRLIMKKKRYLESGKIVNTHGIKGELKIYPWCDSPEFLLDFDRIYIDDVPHTVLSARVHKGMVIMGLEGISDINDAQRYINKVIFIDRHDARLEEGAFFLQDIIGFSVFDERGTRLGILQEVLTRPAGNIYVVAESAEDKNERLIPAVPEFIKKVDLERGKIIVSLIEGM